MEEEGESLPPSCLNVVERQIYILLAYNLQRKRMYKIAQRVIFLMEKFGMRTLLFVLEVSFDLICGNIEANIKRKDVRKILESVVMRFQNDQGFYYFASQYFDSLLEFPEETMHFLTFDSAFSLAIAALDSRHCWKATEYLNEKLVGQLSEYNVYLPSVYSVLLQNLGVRNIPASVFEKGHELDDDAPVENEIDKLEVSIAIGEVLQDFSLSEMLTESFVLSFLRSFPSISFASFLVNLLTDKRGFASEIQVDFAVSIIDDGLAFAKGLDCAEAAKLSRNCVKFIFKVLDRVYDGGMIDMRAFLDTWKHPDSMFKFLSYIAECSRFKFNFNGSGICWSSAEFVRNLVSHPNSCENLRLFKRYATKHADIALLSLIKAKKMMGSDFPLFATLCDCLLDDFFATCRKSTVLDELWNASPKVMRRMCWRYSLTKDYDTILNAVPKCHIDSLLKEDDLNFATEMALLASWHQVTSFAKFVRDRKPQVHAIAPVIVLSVNNKSFSISDHSLNEYFECAAGWFDTLPLDSKRIILAAYNQVKTDRPSINSFDFNFRIQHATDELKFEAARRFEGYMSGDTPLHDMRTIVRNVKSSNKELFEYMTAVLIEETKFVDDHDEEEKERIILLLTDLMKSHVFNENQTNTIFSYVLNNIRTPFAQKIVEKLLNNLGEFTYFASLLLESSDFAQYASQLYKKVENVVDTFTFQEFRDFRPPVKMHKHVIRFKSITIPPPRKAKGLLALFTDTQQIIATIKKNTEFNDWFANCLISSLLDNPSSVSTVMNIVLSVSDDFRFIFLTCCAYKVHVLVSENQHFGDEEGEQQRRKLFVIGKIVGLLTLYMNEPKYLRYFALKELLLYAVSNGKLYGVVPFVCEVLRQGSEIFRPPNPFVSGILSIMASIFAMPSLKQCIRHHIESLFNFFGITVDRMILRDDLYPDKTEDNFDFLTQPFNLSLLFSENQIDRIINYDENLYFCFIAHCINAKSIKQPTPTKMKIIWTLFNLLKQESHRMSEIVVGTALNILTNDVMLVKRFVKQTAASITSQPVFFNYDQTIRYLLADICSDKDFISEFAEKTSCWVHQFLSDITAAIAYSRVKRELDARNFNDSISITMANQWALMKVSPEAIKYTGYDIAPDKAITSQIAIVEDLCRYEISHGHHNMCDLPDMSSLHIALHDTERMTSECTVERLNAVICAFVTAGLKWNATLYQQSLSLMLRYAIEGVSTEQKQPMRCFIEKLLRSNAFPPLLLFNIMNLGIIDGNTVDQIFCDVLNSTTCSSKHIESVVVFLSYYIHQDAKFIPQLFMKTLAIASGLPYSRYQHIKNEILILRKIYSEMNLNCRVIEPRKAFDPLAEIMQSVEYASQFQKFKNAMRQQNESQIVTMSKHCMRSPRDFYIVAFIRESETDLERLFRCMRKVSETKQYLNNIFAALLYIIEGYCCIDGVDFSKFANIIRILMKNTDCIPLLHRLRPLKCAKFTFAWIELITQPRFVASMMQTSEGWLKYLPLLCDYTAAIGYLAGTFEQKVFNLCYKSYLRFILVLSHDMPDFVASVAWRLTGLLPLDFLQLRNIILSVSPKSVVTISPLTPDLKIIHIPDVHQTCFRLAPVILSPLIEESLLKVVTGTFDMENLRVLIECDPLNIPNLVSRAFDVTFEHTDVSSQQRVPFHHLPIVILFHSIMAKESLDTAGLFIEAFIDNLRYASRNTHFFSKLLIEFFKLNIINDGVSVSEMIAVALMKRAALPAPHPWGLHVTIVELMVNKDIGFWEFPFVSASDEKTTALIKSIYYVFCK